MSSKAIASPPLIEETFRNRGQFDPLAEVLRWFCVHFDRSVSAADLTAGSPLAEGLLTLELLPRAAERAGLRTRIVRRPLDQFNPWMLPIAIVLKGGQSCVLAASADPERLRLIFPEVGGIGKGVPRAKVEEAYSGIAVMFMPQRAFEARAEEFVPPKPRRWFWDLIFAQRRIYGEAILAAVLINVFSVASPLFVMNVYDRVVPNQARSRPGRSCCASTTPVSRPTSRSRARGALRCSRA